MSMIVETDDGREINDKAEIIRYFEEDAHKELQKNNTPLELSLYPKK